MSAGLHYPVMRDNISSVEDCLYIECLI